MNLFLNWYLNLLPDHVHQWLGKSLDESQEGFLGHWLRCLVDLFLHNVHIRVAIRRGHVDDALEVFNAAAEVHDLHSSKSVKIRGIFHVFVEFHSRRDMEDHRYLVDEKMLVVCTESHSHTSHVPGNDRQLGENFGTLGTDPVEHFVLLELLETLLRVETLLGSHEDVDVGQIRAAAKKLLDHHFSQETSSAGDEDIRTIVEAFDFSGLGNGRGSGDLHWRVVVEVFGLATPHLGGTLGGSGMLMRRVLIIVARKVFYHVEGAV